MRRVFLSAICLGLLLMMLGAAPALAAASLTVDTFEDTFDGSCADGDCSIRDAVSAVDAGGTVRLPAGFFGLDRTGAGPDAGDIDLSRPVTIVGIGETGSFLDASGLDDRVFDVAANVTLRHLTLLSGGPVGTGGLVRARATSLVLSRITLFAGAARDGGALAVGEDATASIDRSWIFGNEATEPRGWALPPRDDGHHAIDDLREQRRRRRGRVRRSCRFPLDRRLHPLRQRGRSRWRRSGDRRHHVLLRLGRWESCRRGWRSAPLVDVGEFDGEQRVRAQRGLGAGTVVRPAALLGGTERRRRPRVRSQCLR